MSIVSVNTKAGIQTAIAAASRKTGIDFNYLLGQAQVESGMRANARAATSSATGLYQFIEQSWLGVMKNHGAEHGLGWAADSIRQTSSGRYVVSDPAVRRAILEMRSDPGTAALMAAEHASDNKAALEDRLGRPATGTDLYMAHFLGQGGAAKFLGAMESSPDRTGAAMFPSAARANRNIFYASNGQPRTLSEIYARFAGKLDRGAAAVGATGLASDAFEDFSKGIDALGMGDGEVVLGNGAVDSDRHWIETTLAQLKTSRSGGNPLASDPFAQVTVNPFRPTPETAKLAYLMLAKLGA
ncbi:hypothetical protein [Sphingomonas sp. UNC305MFCol5.2]|uniref:hypothetical protein n=1 Tax=Sphingomonas sp. UNC305MFCol5.2 TaxID=1449076 RepID=UPI0004A7277D|nr:hypothetical protein [Sphingomonas sp. UNC305MFCol5.2]